jgi:hypothetical protein
MGKRSKFARFPHDFYATPRAAVVPLIPYLRGVRTFAEPCSGDGALIGHLESFRLRCVWRGDIRHGQDALATDRYGDNEFHCIITNPPFGPRELLHRLIVHFQRIAPTWLLLGIDWASIYGAATILPSCSDIVPIGRVKWFEDTGHASMENFGWFRFDVNHTTGPIFHGRGQVKTNSRSKACAYCGQAYVPQRSTSRFCKDACKQAAYRERLSVTQS